MKETINIKIKDLHEILNDKKKAEDTIIHTLDAIEECTKVLVDNDTINITIIQDKLESVFVKLNLKVIDILKNNKNAKINIDIE